METNKGTIEIEGPPAVAGPRVEALGDVDDSREVEVSLSSAKDTMERVGEGVLEASVADTPRETDGSEAFELLGSNDQESGIRNTPETLAPPHLQKIEEKIAEHQGGIAKNQEEIAKHEKEIKDLNAQKEFFSVDNLLDLRDKYETNYSKALDSVGIGRVMRLDDALKSSISESLKANLVEDYIQTGRDESDPRQVEPEVREELLRIISLPLDKIKAMSGEAAAEPVPSATSEEAASGEGSEDVSAETTAAVSETGESKPAATRIEVREAQEAEAPEAAAPSTDEGGASGKPLTDAGRYEQVRDWNIADEEREASDYAPDLQRNEARIKELDQERRQNNQQWFKKEIQRLSWILAPVPDKWLSEGMAKSREVFSQLDEPQKKLMRRLGALAARANLRKKKAAE